MADPSLQGKLIEFKGATLGVMIASLRDTDAVRLADGLHMMLGGMPDFFAGEPAILDFAQLASAPERVDWTAILSLLRRYQSLAQLQASASKVQATIGLEPVLGSVTDLSLEQLTKEVGSTMAGWNHGVQAPAVAL